MTPVLITACKRPKLLLATLDSFFGLNTAPIGRVIIHEDAHTPGLNDEAKAKYPQIEWIENTGKRRGNIRAWDALYQAIASDKPKYVFRSEDDWEFYRPGFIEDSMAILEANPIAMQVWLREPNDRNRHPAIPINYYAGNIEYQMLQVGFMRHWAGGFDGYSHNPGLHRFADYQKVGPYAKHMEQGVNNNEMRVGKAYFNAGFRAAAMTKGYVRHLGWGQSTMKTDPNYHPKRSKKWQAS